MYIIINYTFHKRLSWSGKITVTITSSVSNFVLTGKTNIRSEIFSFVFLFMLSFKWRICCITTLFHVKLINYGTNKNFFSFCAMHKCFSELYQIPKLLFPCNTGIDLVATIRIDYMNEMIIYMYSSGKQNYSKILFLVELLLYFSKSSIYRF